MDTKTKILVIEDDKYISNFIAVSLKKENYDVYISQSAADGLFMFSSYHPDIILLDLGLPDQDGLELIKELRQFTEIPILVVSARGQENDKLRHWIWGQVITLQSLFTWVSLWHESE